MAEPTYREATIDDADAVARVGQRVWDELAEKSGLPGRLTSEGVRERLESYGGRGAMFVCDTGEGVSGFAALEPDEGDPDAAVMGVWLFPEARGQKIGTELAMMATEFARSAGYRKLRGTIPPQNEPALSFFGDFGSLAQVVGQGMEYELPL
jgi:GNAT superfamily N-acetyltransferase